MDTTSHNDRKPDKTQSQNKNYDRNEMEQNLDECKPMHNDCDSDSKAKGISDPHHHDILCGRGNAVNRHVGNMFFRKIVSHRKPDYRRGAYPYQRRKVAWQIYNEIKNLDPPGRFLMSRGDEWFEVSETKAISKISQALRELASNDPVGMDFLSASSSVSVPSLTSASKSDKSKGSNPSTGLYSHILVDKNKTKAPRLEIDVPVYKVKNKVDIAYRTSQTEENIRFIAKNDYDEPSSSVNSILKDTEFLRKLQSSNGRDSVVVNHCQINEANSYINGMEICSGKSLPRQNREEILLQHSDEERSISHQIKSKVSSSNNNCVSLNSPVEKEEKNNRSTLLPLKKRIVHNSSRISKVQKKVPDHHQQVIMPLSYIGQSFVNSGCSDESKCVFEEIAELGRREDALLHLPSIIGSLCKRVVELEDEAAD